MFCSNCGAQIDDGAKFCPSCGTPVENQPSGVVSQMEQPVMTPVQPMEQPVIEQVQPMEQPVVEPVQPMEQPVVNPFGAPVNNAPADSFGAPVNNAPADPFGAPVNNAPVNPFGAPVNNAPADPFGAPVNNAPADPFGAPVNNVPGGQNPQVLESYGVPGGNNGQWDPLMAPEKKSKKGLIIGLVAGAVALIGLIVLILVLVLSGKDDDEKETTKKSRTTTAAETTKTEKETTKAEKETTTQQTEVEEIEESDAKDLVNAFLELLVESDDINDFADLYSKGAWESESYWFDSTDSFEASVYELTSLDLERFGKVISAEYNSKYTFYTEDDLVEYDYYLSDDEVLTGACYYDIYVDIASEERSGKFNITFDMGIVDGELKILDIYTYRYDVEDYVFTGTGEDEFGEYYELTSSTSGDEEIPDLSDIIITTGVGADSYDEVLTTGLDALFAHNDSEVAKYIAPAIIAIYKSESGENYFADMYSSIGINEPCTKTGITYTEEALSEDDLGMYTFALAMYGISEPIEEAYNVSATISFDGLGDEDFNIVVAKMYGKWFLLDLE